MKISRRFLSGTVLLFLPFPISFPSSLLRNSKISICTKSGEIVGIPKNDETFPDRHYYVKWNVVEIQQSFLVWPLSGSLI